MLYHWYYFGIFHRHKPLAIGMLIMTKSTPNAIRRVCVRTICVWLVMLYCYFLERRWDFASWFESYLYLFLMIFVTDITHKPSILSTRLWLILTVWSIIAFRGWLTVTKWWWAPEQFNVKHSFGLNTGLNVYVSFSMYVCCLPIWKIQIFHGTNNKNIRLNIRSNVHAATKG